MAKIAWNIVFISTINIYVCVYRSCCRYFVHELKLNPLKDRQHRSRGGFEFSLISHEPKGIEGRVICQIKAYICLYSFAGSNMESLIKSKKKEIKSDYFTFIFCANTTLLIFNPQQYNFVYI